MSCVGPTPGVLIWVTLLAVAGCSGVGSSGRPPPNEAPVAASDATPASGEAGIINLSLGGDIIVESSANNSTVAVVMQVSSLDINADAGFHFIVLVDDTGETVSQNTAIAVDGRYEFQFDNVAPGRFRLAAGSDADNDQFICDAGEACGLFRTLDAPTTIELQEDLSGLEFVTGFRSNLSSSGTQAAGESDDRDVVPIRITPPRPRELAK